MIEEMFFTALTASGSADQLSGRSTVRPMAMALGLQLETLVKLRLQSGSNIDNIKMLVG